MLAEKPGRGAGADATGRPQVPRAPFPPAESFVGSQLPLVRDAQLHPGTQVGEYVVESKVGEGGMGTVYRARHPLIGKEVAIKVIKPMFAADPVAVDRFVREARAVNEIRHQNIIDIFAFGQIPAGLPYFVMEYLDGHTLQDELGHRASPCQIGDVLPLLRPVFSALEATHAAGVIHRDIKPENIFIVQRPGLDPHIKLLDFGLVKLAREAGGASRQTSAGMPMGTPDYMAPEQSIGRAVDHRADIYSLGVILYAMVAGRLPFAGESSLEVLEQHRSAEPPPPSIFAPVPRAVEEVILWAMRKDPAQRPQSVRALWDALEAAALQGSAVRGAAPLSSPAVEPSAIEPSPSRPTFDSLAMSARRDRRVLLPFLVGAGAVVALLAVVVAVWPRAEQKPARQSVAAPHAPAPGTIRLDVVPADGTLSVDGVPVAAGTDLSLAPGRHVLRAARPGFVTREEPIMISSGKTGARQVVLQPEPAPAAKPAPTAPAMPAKAAAASRKRGARDLDDTFLPTWVPPR
jgi:eukaryotic-like serine/threonine-protein kinase